MSQAPLEFLDFHRTRLAYRLRKGVSPALMFLPGYASDMDGTKALAIDALAAARGLTMLRFDYSGTGSSDGRFEDGTLGGWLEQALHMLDTLIDGPVILIGSSMGGWLALLIATRRPDRIAALVGIAAAADFTNWGFSEADKAELRNSGKLEQPNPYGPDPFVTTFDFWQSGESLRLLDKPIPVDCPVRLIHGEVDGEVDVQVASKTLKTLRSADVQLLVVKGGGHRLSEPREIDAIVRTIAALVESPE
jgi:pimeloyl-ACP methyl ester carboxylesterase